MGYKTDTKKSGHSYRYFVRTDEKGGNIGDTSDQDGWPDDFKYDFDTTCAIEKSMPRKNSNLMP